MSTTSTAQSFLTRYRRMSRPVLPCAMSPTCSAWLETVGRLVADEEAAAPDVEHAWKKGRNFQL